MQVLSELVKIYFPDERVIAMNKVKLQDTWKVSMGNLPISYTKMFYLKSLDMVETDRKYYFDRRQPMLFQSKISVIFGPIILSFLIFVYLNYVHTPLSYSLPISVAIFLFGSLLLGWNIKINQGLVNILTINKEWIQKSKQQGNLIVIYGEIPQGGSYSFISHLLTDIQNKLSFTEKLFAGVYFGGLNSLPVSASFTLQIEKV